MLRFELINKEWIVSRTARSVYRSAAVLSLSVLPVLWVAVEDGGMFGPLGSVLRTLLFIGALGMAVTGLGMEYFLFRFDNSSPVKQIFWFCALFFAPIGPALYCFLVYSRSDVLRSACTEGPS